jgi:hypothetical protein
MGLTTRTIYQLQCDHEGCSSRLVTPTHEHLIQVAFEEGDWQKSVIEMGEGRGELRFKCPAHRLPS